MRWDEMGWDKIAMCIQIILNQLSWIVKQMLEISLSEMYFTSKCLGVVVVQCCFQASLQMVAGQI